MNKALVVLAEAGIIPESILEEMVRWRALPEEMLNVSSRKPLDTGDGSGVQTQAQLLARLQRALRVEDGTIRQTILDEEGEPKLADVTFRNKARDELSDVPVRVLADGAILATVVSLTDSHNYPVRRVARFSIDDVVFEVESSTPIYQDEELSSFLFDVRRK